MKKIYLSITIIGFAFTVMGQTGKLDKANASFEQFNYAEAIDLYEDALPKSSDGTAIKSKLAYSYLKIGNFQKAIHYYGELMNENSSAADPMDFYHYAYALKVAGDYEESDKWMTVFSQKKSADSRAERFINDKNYKERIEGIKPFFVADEVGFNSPGTDFGGYLNKEGNYLYFLSTKRKEKFVKRKSARDKKAFLDLYRIYIDHERIFGAVERVKTGSTKLNEGPIAFSNDGKTVYITRNEPSKVDGIHRLKIFIADITEGGAIKNERPFKYNGEDYSVGHPALSPDGKTLYFVSDKPGGFGGADIYRADILENGGFGAMTNLGETVNTEGQELFPFMDDENRLFFSSDGHIGLGGLDVYVGFMRGKAVVEVQNLGAPVNSSNDDFAFTWHKDIDKGYVSSNRNGDDNIYALEALRPLVYGLIVKGKATDENGQAIAFTMMEIRDENGNLLQSAFTDENGAYSFNLPYDENYILKASKQDHFNYVNRFNSFTKNNSMQKDFVLKADPGLSLYGIVTNEFTKEIIEGVEVKIKDLKTKEETIHKTEYTGDFVKGIYDKSLKDKGSYEITLSKDGYHSKTVVFNVTYENKGQYNIHTVESLSLKPN